VVVSLLEAEESSQLGLLEEASAAQANGVRFVSFPIPDRGVPASSADVPKLMAETLGALEQGENVAVHCRQSIGRAGMIAAGVLIASGTKPDEAIGTVSRARGLTIPETEEQRDWVRRLSSATVRVI
jgi:protein-tyrosine phosphatase